MTILYVATENVNIQLFIEFDEHFRKDMAYVSTSVDDYRDQYIEWMFDYKVPNAESIVLTGDYEVDTEITFKEEKDLIVFLLTL